MNHLTRTMERATPINDTTEPRQLAADTAREANRVAANIDRALQWIEDRTPDGYPTTTIGTGDPGGSSSEPASSSVLNAIIATRTITIAGTPVDVRTARLILAQHLTGALNHLRAAAKILQAVPLTADGHTARTTDYERRHSRCEGWGPQHAICDDNSVKATVVDGSHTRLCDRCYRAMWRSTLPTPDQTGRLTRDAGT